MHKILIVDDEEAFTRIVKLNLEDTGNYEVKAENNPKEAGQLLYVALLNNAKERAKADIETMLADDTLTLAELDTLI